MVSEQYVKLLDPVVFDEQRMMQILPHWGLSDHEVLSTIRSAVGSTRPTEIPSQMKEVLISLGAIGNVCAESDEESPVMPVAKELPGILQNLSDHAPEEFKEATLMAAMPMLGTLATGIRAKYQVRATSATWKLYLRSSPSRTWSICGWPMENQPL
jgi:hypothetical protein